MSFRTKLSQARLGTVLSIDTPVQPLTNQILGDDEDDSKYINNDEDDNIISNDKNNEINQLDDFLSFSTPLCDYITKIPIESMIPSGPNQARHVNHPTQVPSSPNVTLKKATKTKRNIQAIRKGGLQRISTNNNTNDLDLDELGIDDENNNTNTNNNNLNPTTQNNNNNLDEILLNLYSNPWYRLNQTTRTTSPLNIAPTSPLMTLTAQTASSINPYKEIKHRFGSTILLPPPNNHKERFLADIQRAGHIQADEKRRLMALYSRDIQANSLLAFGMPLQRSTAFQLHFCENYTLSANNLKDKTQFTPNTILYYAFVPTNTYYQDFKTFEDMQSTHDYHSVIEYCLRKPSIPQCVYHLSYIYEYHNQISQAFDWIRVAMTTFETALGQDVLYGLFCGKVRFVNQITPTEAQIITNLPNTSLSRDLAIIQRCNTELIHCLNRTFARYSHFLTKKAASGSAFGLTLMASQLCNHTMIASNGSIASYSNLHPLTNINTISVPLLSNNNNNNNNNSHNDSMSSVLMNVARTPEQNNYQIVQINELYSHLTLSPKSIITNFNKQFDQASLTYFCDYYGLKGNRYLDVLLAGLYTIPHYFGSGTFDITQSIYAPITLDSLLFTNPNNNNNTNPTNNTSSSSTPFKTPYDTTSLSELHYAYSCGILSPLLTTYYDQTLSRGNSKELSIKLTPNVTKALFPMLITPSRWTLNWSYSMAYAMIKLERQCEKIMTKQYENQQLHQQHNLSFLNKNESNNNHNPLEWFQLSNQIDYVSNIDLITLLSLESISMNELSPILTTPYHGLTTSYKQQQYLSSAAQVRIGGNYTSPFSSNSSNKNDSFDSLQLSTKSGHSNNNNNNNVNDKNNKNANPFQVTQQNSIFPTHPLLHILSTASGHGSNHHHNSTTTTTTSNLHDSSISFTPITGHPNLNTPTTSGSAKGKQMNGLSSISGNNLYRSMLSSLFPMQFIAMAYLARAIILFPEVIQLLCDMPAGESTTASSSDSQNTTTSNTAESENATDDVNNSYVAQTDLSTNAKLQFIINFYKQNTTNANNKYYDKASTVYSKRSAALWKQTNLQHWIEGGIVAAYNVLFKYQQLHMGEKLRDETTNVSLLSNIVTTLSSPFQTDPLSSALTSIRSVLYNQTYFSAYEYPLKTLEQCDYCDDVVVFDTNGIFASPDEAVQQRAIRRNNNNPAVNDVTLTGMMGQALRDGGNRVWDAFRDFIHENNAAGNVENTQPGRLAQFFTDFMARTRGNNDDNSQGEDIDDDEDDEYFDFGTDDEDDDENDGGDIAGELAQLELELNQLGMDQSEISAILAEEESRLVFEQSSQPNNSAPRNNSRRHRGNNITSNTTDNQFRVGDDIIEDVDPSTQQNNANNGQMDEDFIE